MSGCDTALTRISRLAVALALLLMGTGHAWAQAPAGGPNEGIAVHGHWTIEVRNPDGALVERREIENELFTTGADRLSGILSRNMAPGHWAIQAGGGNAGPCIDGGCVIVPTGASVSPALAYGLAVVHLRIGDAGGPGIVLNGQYTADRNGTITQVATFLQTCVATTPFESCTTPLLPGNPAGVVDAGGVIPAFTATSFAAIAVQAGQIVQVSVTITFS